MVSGSIVSRGLGLSCLRHICFGCLVLCDLSSEIVIGCFGYIILVEALTDWFHSLWWLCGLVVLC